MSESPLLSRFFTEVESGAARNELAYSTAVLDQLDGDDRLRAIAFLLARADTGDIRAVETLGIAGRRESVAALRGLSKRAGDLGASAARAVLDVEQRIGVSGEDPAMVQRIAESAAGAGSLGSAMAAHRLRFTGGQAAVDGLIEALSSPFDSTRANANLGLRDRLGLAPLIEPRQAPLFALQMRLLCDLEAVWRPAAQTLQSRIRGLVQGAAPAELGLNYKRESAPEDIAAFWASADDPSTPWNLEARGRLRGHDLQWADAYLLAKTWDREDTPKALVGLNIAGTRAALAEAAARVKLAGFPNPWRDALEQLDTLKEA